MQKNDSPVEQAVAQSGKKKLRKPRKWSEPRNVERNLFKAMKLRIEYIKTRVNVMFTPELLISIKNRLNAELPQGAKLDQSIEESIDAIADQINQEVWQEYPESSDLFVGQNTGSEVDKFNQDQFNKIMAGVLGITLFSLEPWKLNLLNGFSTRVKRMLRDMKNQVTDRIARTINTGFDRQRSVPKILNDIEKAFDAELSKAKFWASDQVQNLNAQMVKNRQAEVGIDKYRWRTQQDDKVRPTHASKEGKIFRWDDPPFGTGHPGEDYNCRCWAEPIFPEPNQE